MSFIYPPLYEHWLRPRLAVAVTESLATCDDCAMVRPAGLTRDPGPFRADLKCCTYFPFVPNFGLGAMLAADAAGAGARFAAARAQGLFLPTGLHAAAERELLQADAGPDGFGRDPRLLCPFHDRARNRCGVWANRPGVCATYFCKSERGADGLAYWRAAEEYLNHFEWSLANWAAARLGLDDERVEMCKAALSIEEAGEERDYFLRAAWGDDHGREAAFYARALEAARAIAPAELAGLLGPRGAELEDALRNV